MLLLFCGFKKSFFIACTGYYSSRSFKNKGPPEFSLDFMEYDQTNYIQNIRFRIFIRWCYADKWSGQKRLVVPSSVYSLHSRQTSIGAPSMTSKDTAWKVLWKLTPKKRKRWLFKKFKAATNQVPLFIQGLKL